MAALSLRVDGAVGAIDLFKGFWGPTSADWQGTAESKFASAILNEIARGYLMTEH